MTDVDVEVEGGVIGSSTELSTGSKTTKSTNLTSTRTRTTAETTTFTTISKSRATSATKTLTAKTISTDSTTPALPLLEESLSVLNLYCEPIADKIFERFVLREKADVQVEKENDFQTRLRNELQELDDQYICVSCLNLSPSSHLPHSLRSRESWMTGFFKKT